METKIDIPKRSVKLKDNEKMELREFCEKFYTEVDAALTIGIDRNVLARVRQVGSGSEITIEKIRIALECEKEMAK